MASSLEPTPYQHPYGYLFRSGSSVNLDTLSGSWATKKAQPWQRRFELFVKVAEPVCFISPEFLADFHRICRDSFRYIAERHVLTPIRMWLIVRDHLALVGMHEDDIEFCQNFIFGWAEIEPEQMERFRWRYPERCPLLDVLCTMDETHHELNQFQDLMLELKGSKGRRRLDVIPPLPEPDGVRPVGVPA